MATVRDYFRIPAGTKTEDYLNAVDFEVPTNKNDVVNLLSNILLNAEFENEVRAIFESAAIGNEWLRGAFGYVLFAINAERFALDADGKQPEVPKKHFVAANTYLRADAVIAFIKKEYAVERYIDNTVRLHKVGTTSYILLTGLNHILKIIKYKYVSNTIITLSTHDYKNNFPHYSPFVPTIYDSGYRFIYMEYVQGITLREYMRSIDRYPKGKRKGRIRKEALDEIKSIFLNIYFTLKKFAENGIFHFDLSPSNILIQRAADGKPMPWLIDFGINFLFIEKVGRTSEYASSQYYFAPELSDGDQNGSIKSDIYSLGIMLVEILSGHQLGDKDLSFCLDSVWREYTDIAILAEQMIDRKPENRFFEHGAEVAALAEKRLNDALEDPSMIQHIRAAVIYDVVSNKVKDEFTIYMEYKFGERAGLGMLFRIIPKVLSGPIDRIKEMRRKWKEIKKLGIHDTNTVKLYRWSILTEALHSAILAVIIVLTLHDFGVLPKVLAFFGAGNEFLDKILAQIPMDPAGHWPSRIVGLTFSIVATKYYIEIFSLISGKGISKTLEFILRLNSWIFSLPILWGLLYRPSDWPYCAAAGVWLVTINNYASFAWAKKSKEKIEKTLDLPTTYLTQSFLDDFGNWWYGMLGYGLALIAMGILINLGIAKDAKIYAAAVAVLGNLIFLYRIPCTKKANNTRSGLERLFSGMKRSMAIEAAKEADSKLILGG